MTMENILHLQEERILMILEKLKDKVVVFDFDGTLTEFHYDKTHLLPCKDDYVKVFALTNNLYANARCLETLKFIISHLDPKNIYILTRTDDSVVDSKNDIINREFPMFTPENIFHVLTSDAKLEVLKKLHEERNENIIFVEDTFKTILDGEEKFPFVFGVHISSFLA